MVFLRPINARCFGWTQSAYDCMRQGKVRIAEVLNGPLTAREQVRVTEAHGWSKSAVRCTIGISTARARANGT